MSLQTNFNISGPCPCCGLYPNRGLSIDALILLDKKIVLIKRLADPYQGYWALPGGYIDWNISAKDTVKKEVKEETNLDTSEMKLLSVYSSPHRHPKQTISLLFQVTASGKLKAGDDAGEVKLFPLDDLPTPLAFDHEQMIKDYKKS